MSVSGDIYDRMEHQIMQLEKENKELREKCISKQMCVKLVDENRIPLNKIKQIVHMAEDWCEDQENGITDGEVCISAMKDIRRIIK